MHSNEFLIERTKKLFESHTGWGDSNDWTNQDFVILSEKIQERTGVGLSHVTLKRVWGKVKYHSLPTTHTLDTLVRFLGYEHWRDFKSQNSNGAINTALMPQTNRTRRDQQIFNRAKKMKDILKIGLIVIVLAALAGAWLYIRTGRPLVRNAPKSGAMQCRPQAWHTRTWLAEKTKLS